MLIYPARVLQPQCGTITYGQQHSVPVGRFSESFLQFDREQITHSGLKVNRYYCGTYEECMSDIQTNAAPPPSTKLIRAIQTVLTLLRGENFSPKEGRGGFSPHLINTSKSSQTGVLIGQ
jgi:hypothetical protein